MTSDELNWRFIHTPKAFLYLSIALHLTIPLFFGTVAVLDKLGWSLLGPRKPQKEIYQEFIQVDMVGLPDQLISDQDNVDTNLPMTDKNVPPAKVEEPPAPPVEAKGEEKGKTEEDVMAELEAKRQAETAAKAKAEKERKDKENAEREKVLKQMEAEAKRDAALKELAEKGSRGKLKGNILSKGTSAKGLIGTAKDRYISLIAQKVKKNFSVYAFHKKRGLVGVVFLKVDAKGNLKEKRLVTPSKDQLFNTSLMQAVVESQPFPVPDDDSVLREGITIEFHPDD